MIYCKLSEIVSQSKEDLCLLQVFIQKIIYQFYWKVSYYCEWTKIAFQISQHFRIIRQIRQEKKEPALSKTEKYLEVILLQSQ